MTSHDLLSMIGRTSTRNTTANRQHTRMGRGSRDCATYDERGIARAAFRTVSASDGYGEITRRDAHSWYGMRLKMVGRI